MGKKRGDLATVAVLAVVYFAAAKLGLKLAFVHPSATPVWAPTGITLAAFLILGVRVWPGVLVGAFLANITTAGSVLTSIGIAAGNTLEGVLGAYLVTRFAGGRNAFSNPLNIFKFATLAGMLSTTVSPTMGVTILLLGGFAKWADYSSIWVTWWLGDAVGNVLVAPFLLLWISDWRVRWNLVRLLEFGGLLTALFLTGRVVFGGLLPSAAKNYPLEYMCIPLLIWAAFRFGRREAATATLALAAIAIGGTLQGFGPFVAKTKNESLLILQLFLAILAVMGLVLAAAVAERKRVAERFGRAVESAPNAMVMVDPQGKIVLVNSPAIRMFGRGREELVGQSVDVLVPERFRGAHPEHRAGFSAHPQARPMGAGRDLYAVRKDGSEFPVEIGLNPIETEEGLLVLSAIVDITARKQAEDEIRRLATTDSLTGLVNYRKLMDTVEAEIKRFDRTRRPFAVMLLDLDGLKKINDTYGHLVGSRALCRLANVLRAHCRQVDTPARYGGDEFAVVLPETGSGQARQIAARIRERIASDGESPPISVSVGTAIFPEDGEATEKLLSAADRALYGMKRPPAGSAPPQEQHHGPTRK
ncbi:MAG TPA: MASE1 domain-containing protein [Candidatus Acidoferrales bacterium]|nr:MASE1 domain-containing protein [Candidatus Acidoferrales bacterium]